jgi:hypothetical protein
MSLTSYQLLYPAMFFCLRVQRYDKKMKNEK